MLRSLDLADYAALCLVLIMAVIITSILTGSL